MNDKLFERIINESKTEFPNEINFEKSETPLEQKLTSILSPNDIIDNILKSEYKPNILVVCFQY